MQARKSLTQRQANWDLLRGFSMFLVVVVHTATYLPEVSESFNLESAVGRMAIICDPIFFMLSGFFALRPLKGSLKDYYLKKVPAIIFPLFLYSVSVYFLEYFIAGSNANSLSFINYLQFAADKMHANWWFIPTLVPFLILAPFIYAALEGLSDTWIVRLAKLFGGFLVYGVVFHILQTVATNLEAAPMTNTLAIIAVPFPHTLLKTYLPCFLAGYLYLRLSRIVSKRTKTWFCIAGVAAYIACFIMAGFGVKESDPDQIWMIAAFCSFFIFERIRISGKALQSVVVWTGKRSYSIYLLHFTLIPVMVWLLYDPASPLRSVFGDPASFSIPVQILYWILLPLMTFYGTLIAVSIVDVVLLENLQRLYNLAVFRRTPTTVPTALSNTQSAQEAQRPTARQRTVHPRITSNKKPVQSKSDWTS